MRRHSRFSHRTSPHPANQSASLSGIIIRAEGGEAPWVRSVYQHQLTHTRWVRSVYQHQPTHTRWVRSVCQHRLAHTRWVRSVYQHRLAHTRWVRSVYQHQPTHTRRVRSVYQHQPIHTRWVRFVSQLKRLLSQEIQNQKSLQTAESRSTPQARRQFSTRCQVVPGTTQISFKSALVLSLLALITLTLTSVMAQAQTPPTVSDTVAKPTPVQAPITPQQQNQSADPQDPHSTYLLGVGDQITVRVIDLDEFGSSQTPQPYRIDNRGSVMLPLVGRIKAAGLTVEQFEFEISSRLMKYVKDPEVVINVLETRSQPVSVLGAVRTPGVLQLQGNKTLFEIISMAGGLNPDAGYSIRITRRKSQWGALPLPNAKDDPTGKYSIAEINVKDVMNAERPEENVAIKPNDVVTVPKGEIVYVVGSVKKSGGFVLGERDRVTALQALALAEGLDAFSAPSRAKIVRPIKGSDQKNEISLDLKRVLDGKAQDVALMADDVLFVPSSAGKKAAAKTVDALIGIGSGLAIYRGGIPH